MKTLNVDLGLCRVRPFWLDDAASLAEQANDREVWINLLDHFPHPYTAVDAQAWLVRVVNQSPSTHFAIEVEGRAVGSVGFQIRDDVFRRSADLGYWLGREFWGRGIASEAVKAVTAHAFDQFDLIRIQAGVFAWNPASSRVLEKAGYTFEGRLRSSAFKDGQITDELLYAIIQA